MLYLESPSVDPYFNLALEEYVFSSFDRSREYFMLWRNSPSVIIGKHQNVQQEVNLPYARTHRIPIVRRLSGGGAVYHDLNNLNFTFIVDGSDVDLSMERFTSPLIAACLEYGIHAKVEGRNDVTVDGKKISGNSRYLEEGRTLHHGTILLQTDCETMEQVLCVSKDKIHSKGIESVKSRVTGLSECAGYPIPAEEFAAVLKKKVLGTTDPRPYTWTLEDLKAIRKLRDERYATWNWNYGFFPIYDVTRRRRIAGCGIIEAGMQVLGGQISSIRLTGDFLEARPVSELEEQLVGRNLNPDSLAEEFRSLVPGNYICGLTAEALADILCGLTEE